MVREGRLRGAYSTSTDNLARIVKLMERWIHFGTTYVLSVVQRDRTATTDSL